MCTHAREKMFFTERKYPESRKALWVFFSFDKHGNGKYVSPHNKGYGVFVCAHFGGGEAGETIVQP